jgi:multiple sugar transport system permease protein
VILPDLMGAFGIFMLRQFIVSLPNELIDSARLDGCSEFGIYWRIILPLIVPALAVFAIITFIDTWNDFLWPLIVISTPARRTLPLGLAVFADEYVVENNLAMAASIIVLAPVVVVFAIFQRRIIDSVALSGLKEG